MMFYVIRIIIIALIFLACFLLLRKRKASILRKITRKKRIIGIVLSVVIVGLLFIPYEAPFIRFDSPGASVGYSTIKGNLPLHVVKGENTVFTLQNANNNYYFHTILKHNDKYGFCDYHSKIDKVINSPFTEDDNFSGSIVTYKLSSSETNEACYMIMFSKTKRMEQNKIAVFSADNTPIDPVFQNDKAMVFAFVRGTNESDAAFSYTYNGQLFRLD